MSTNFEKEYYEDERFWEESSLSDPMNTMRIVETIHIIPQDVKTIADIGCGNGIFINQLRREKPQIETMACDRSTTALRYVEGPKKEGSIDQLDFRDREFDCVSCLEVIEHLPIQLYKNALSELARISDKYLIISVPYNEDLELDANQCPSCKSIFNANLHLRNYDAETFKHLFDHWGFKCIEHKLLGKTVHFKYHKEYRKIFYASQFRQWYSPICPICGFQEPVVESRISGEVKAEKKASNSSLLNQVKSAVLSLPKALWPKEEKHYWILGLFKRS